MVFSPLVKLLCFVINYHIYWKLFPLNMTFLKVCFTLLGNINVRSTKVLLRVFFKLKMK